METVEVDTAEVVDLIEEVVEDSVAEDMEVVVTGEEAMEADQAEVAEEALEVRITPIWI